MSASKKKSKAARIKAEELLSKSNNGWSGLGARERRQVFRLADDYRAFISAAKTEREAHDQAVALARDGGYRSLEEVAAAGGSLAPGDRVYAGIGGKALLLAHLGRRPVAKGLRIVGGHTDAPRLDLKPRPLYEDGEMALFDTHYYGGVRKYQWVALPLALHGVVVRRDGTTVPVCIGEQQDDPVLVITDLLPHLAKDQANKKLRDAITGEGLNVLVGSCPGKDDAEGKQIKLNILRLLHERYGIDETDFISAELEVVPAGPARDLGLDASMILAYGHDDRVCAYTGLRALLDLKKTPASTAVCLLCDKEEIGSVGATGMDSFLFENVMAEILHLAGEGDSSLALRRCLQNSRMLSADVNALHDPNYPEVSSPNDNMARMNHGLILTKYVGGGGKGRTNDASAEYMAALRQLFDNAKVTWQTGEIGKVDQGGGGTIAYMLARYGMEVADCGVGLLSMHAPWEVAAKLDIYMAWKGYRAFYQWD